MQLTQSIGRVMRAIDAGSRGQMQRYRTCRAGALNNSSTGRSILTSMGGRRAFSAHDCSASSAGFLAFPSR